MEDSTEHPVGFASRTLNAAERNYSQLNKEEAAIMFSLKKFHKQINERYFVIMTYQTPLVSLFGELKQVPVTVGAHVTLRGYEYKIHYKAARSHGNADCLSRLPLPVGLCIYRLFRF